ncbi:MAG: GNA1162 family protein [Thermodesulfobacteriota bacterium]
MRPTKKKAILLCALLVPVLSCSSTPFLGTDEPAAPAWVKAPGGPGIAVVLPFENLTTEPELETLVRTSFYSHFTAKAYRDIELTEVDRALVMLRNTSSRTWQEHSSTSLGRFFQADFVIYGKVLEYSKFFGGIYSQIALKVQVEVVDARTGTGLWQKTVIQRSHEGGFPFTLFGIIPEAVRSGLHMRQERTLDLIERVSRELVGAIPDPPTRSAVSPFFLDIQVASFLEKTLAEKARQDLQQKGYQARVESAAIGDRTWHRVLIGPYRETAEAERVRTSISGDPRFKPILIYHSEGNRGESTSGD